MAERGDLVFRVARRIAARRRERGLSQEGLAALLDIAVKNVQRIESGKQNLSLATLERISTALETSPERLITGASSEAQLVPSAVERLQRAGYSARGASDRGRRPANAVPITTLRAAAGHLSGVARSIEVLGWAALPRRGTPPEGQFIAEVSGASMAPSIPAGSLCLFGRPGPPPIEGRILLVAHADLADEDLGGPYALKRVASVKKRRDGRLRITLEPLNPSYEAIVLDAGEDELRAVAELVRVLVR